MEEAYLLVGKPQSADDVIDKWANNVNKLEKKYIDEYASEELYGNFLWSDSPMELTLRYRTPKEGYEKEGWYIFTRSASSLQEGFDYGEFFLSNDGYLMPAVRTCAKITCCL